MLQALLERVVAREERRFEVPLGYLREIAAASSAALLKLWLIAPAAAHRRRLPLEAYHVARLCTALQADCGACAQIVVKIARQEGVEPRLLRAIAQGRLTELSAELRETAEFTGAVLAGHDPLELREALTRRWGAAGVIELGLAIATAQLLPTLKRAMGRAQSCSFAPVEV